MNLDQQIGDVVRQLEAAIEALAAVREDPRVIMQEGGIYQSVAAADAKIRFSINWLNSMKGVTHVMRSIVLIALLAAVPFAASANPPAALTSNQTAWANNSMIFWCMGRSGVPFGTSPPDGTAADGFIRNCLRNLRGDWQYYTRPENQ